MTSEDSRLAWGIVAQLQHQHTLEQLRKYLPKAGFSKEDFYKYDKALEVSIVMSDKLGLEAAKRLMNDSPR